MKEDLVSLELAKILKEKGFDPDPEYYYLPNPNIPDNRHVKWLSVNGETYAEYVLVPRTFIPDPFNGGKTIEQYYKKGLFQNTFPAPTLGLVQKWLREVHQIYVDVATCFYNEPDEIIFQCNVSKANDRDSLYNTLCHNGDDYPLEFSSYEEV